MGFLPYPWNLAAVIAIGLLVFLLYLVALGWGFRNAVRSAMAGKLLATGVDAALTFLVGVAIPAVGWVWLTSP